MLLLPVILLTVTSAIECLFASRAYFVFAEITLWGTTETAFLHKILVFPSLLSLFAILIEFNEMFKPLLRSIMVPRIDEIDLISTDALSREFLGRELVQEMILILMTQVV